MVDGTGVASRVRVAVTGYRHLAALWVRASMTYRASFWMLTVAGFVIGALDLLGIVIIFTNVDDLGGFGLAEIAFLYGASGLGLAVADLLVGRIERLGQMVRTGRLDTMMVRPVPLLAQVCADEFALRRLSRVVLMVGVLAVGGTVVDWTPGRAVVTAAMVVSAAVIYVALFVGFACIQFWTAESAEVANAFTYGGNTVTQYPLTIFPSEVVLGLTFVAPLAFVNWYPALHVLGRTDPFGLPAWVQLCSPLAAGLCAGVSALAWRTGVRRYTSTGS